MFPEKLIKHGLTRRISDKCTVKRANTERLKRSSIFYMQNQFKILMTGKGNKSKKTLKETQMDQQNEVLRGSDK